MVAMTVNLPTPQALQRVMDEMCSGAVRVDEPLAPHTSWRLGGPADVWVEPAGRSEAVAVLVAARERGWPVTVLGGGSNVLVADKGVRGIVLNLTPGLSEVIVAGTEATAGAGITLFRLAKRLARAGLAGAEFCIGIPGTLGGALAGNAGAFGGEICDITRAVELYEFETGRVVTWDATSIEFGYRSSSLRGKGVILSGTLGLRAATGADVEQQLRALSDERSSKQPVEPGSGGSVFKNPAGGFAGQWIDEAGLKGHRVGGAMVSSKHANFFVNDGTATAADVRALIHDVQAQVEARFGVRLEEEIRYVGDWS